MKCISATEDNIELNDCLCGRVKNGPQTKCCFTQLWRVYVAAESSVWTWPPAEAGHTQCMRKHILSKCNCSGILAVSAANTCSNQKSLTFPSVFVEVALSRDRQMLSINCNSRTTSEVLLIDLTTSHFEPFLVQPRQVDLLYHVEHWRKWLIILANTGPGQEYQVTS